MTKARDRAWLRSYNAGRSYRAIAAEAGVNESTVRRALADHPRQPRRPGPRRTVKPDTAKVVATWQAIGSIRGTGRALGVSETFVRARLAENEIVEHPDQRPRRGSQAHGSGR